MRPVRDELFEAPYRRALLHIQEPVRLSPHRSLFVRFERDCGVTIVVLLGSFNPKNTFLVQRPPQESQFLDNAASALLSVWHVAKDPRHKPNIFVPAALLQHTLFRGVVESTPARQLLYRLGQLDILEFMHVLPESLPPKYQPLLQVPYSAQPQDKVLVRTLDARWARFYPVTSWTRGFVLPGGGGGQDGNKFKVTLCSQIGAR